MEPFLGHSGWLIVTLFTVEALDLAEDYLIVAAVTDEGTMLDEETATRLLSLPGHVTPLGPRDEVEIKPESIDAAICQRQIGIQKDISQRNARFFEAEADKLDGWADDLKVGLEREIKELDRQIKETRRAAMAALTLEEKLAGQKQIKALEAQRNQKRRSLFDAQDDVDRQREALIAKIEGKLKQKETSERLFLIHWTLG